MSAQDQYMADFMAVFQGLDRWGPGSDSDSLRALSILATPPHKIVDIGCGKGFSTTLLAQHTQAGIIAIDNEPQALARLKERLHAQGLDQDVTTVCASMSALPFSPASFDLVWAEGSAYIMGVEQALNSWKLLLQPQGCLVISDLVWLSEGSSQEVKQFWQKEYPDMQSISTRLIQIQSAGYNVLNHFTLSEQAWLNYYQPLKARIAELRACMPQSVALDDLSYEVSLYETSLDKFGYEMFVLQLAN